MISGKASKESSEPITGGEPHEPREREKKSNAGEVLEAVCRFQGNSRIFEIVLVLCRAGWGK